jgi:hypothetical protein|tara:strand:+ start:8196 stop:9038 length:843 start_codon:yes stop_codon:yes gene_type:complete
VYFPKNKIITNLYTGGREYKKAQPKSFNELKFSDDESYVGYYWRTQTGFIFTGKNPNDKPSIRLFPIKVQNTNLPTTDPGNTLVYNGSAPPRTERERLDPYNGIAPDLYNAYTLIKGLKPPRKFPTNLYIMPTQKDYELGAFRRYFLFKSTDKEFLEVDKNVYDKIYKKDRNWVFELYVPFSILWTLSGDEIDVQNANREITLLTQKRLRVNGLTQFLRGNYLQYYEDDMELDEDILGLEISPPSPTPPSPTTVSPSTPTPSTGYTPPSSPSLPTAGGGY